MVPVTFIGGSAFAEDAPETWGWVTYTYVSMSGRHVRHLKIWVNAVAINTIQNRFD